jgi:hypothetical protein
MMLPGRVDKDMGHNRNYDVGNIINQIRLVEAECKHPYTDGYVAWGAKQDLYQLKWLIEQSLRNCPTFGPEPDWLKEQEKKKIIKILKDEV